MRKDTTTITKYAEVKLSHIIQEYAYTIECADGPVVGRTWYIDTAKDALIVKLYVEINTETRR